MDWLSFACEEQWKINDLLKICREHSEHIMLIVNVIGLENLLGVKCQEWYREVGVPCVSVSTQ